MKSKYPGSFWILLAAPVILLILVRILGFDGLFGQDTYVYTKYSEDLRSLCTKGIKTWFFLAAWLFTLVHFAFLSSGPCKPVIHQYVEPIRLFYSICISYLILHSIRVHRLHHVIAYLFCSVSELPIFKKCNCKQFGYTGMFCICGSVYHSLTFKIKILPLTSSYSSFILPMGDHPVSRFPGHLTILS